ncbi:BNR/Asp-box repeat [Variovorax sp. SRS16]|uniref:Ig-like domain-containing protein n=1 Tax=Variovorax sp. SRS16 TaxID=282217 RepID=UPI0013163A73|nr:Ig-like domain-containing protein [Variovorax sp. SRS16]VTU18209.1 BNR/Asp-box repeat [Variovorax sp. SRS16]
MNPSLSPLRLPAGAFRGRRLLRASSQLLALEQRFMFDGAAADAAHHAQAAHDSAPPPVPPAVQVRAIEPAKDEGKKEVVVVDTSLANYKSLEAGVRDGVGIVEFDGSRDGLAQIAQWAATQSGLDAIHILSHGSEGKLDLGTTVLSDATLASGTVQTELAEIGHALTAGGDLLLYGCDVAAGSDGQRFVDDLASLTGADIAASTNATGAADRGGDWTLETHVGKVATDALHIDGYQGLLTVLTFDPNTDSDLAGWDQTSITRIIDGRTFTLSGGGGSGGLGVYSTADTGDASSGIFAYEGSSGGHDVYKLTLQVQSGYMFDLSAFEVVASSGSLTLDLTYADGSTRSITQSGLETWQTLSSFSASTDHVTQVVLTANDYALFQNFDIENVKLLPPTATVATAHLSNDTGTSSSDFITNTAAQTISGTLSANLGSGEKVQVSYDNGNSWSDATSYAVGSSAWSTTTTLAGGSTFLARVSNVDSSSTAYSHSYTLDTTAPTTAFTGISLSADTGASSTDFITRTAAQTITATLTNAPAGTDVVWGSTDGGSSWTDITSKVSGTTLSWNGATLGAGSSSIMLKVTDAAGNDSSLSFQNYTLDTTAPAKSVASAAFSNDSGSSSSDFITNAAAQTISGTLSANLASGESVQVSLDNGASWFAATANVGQNTWSLAGHTLTASSTLQVKVSDRAGNDGAVLSQAYVYDTTAPTTTFGGLALSADTGTSNSDFITRTAAQTISATLSAAPAGGDIVWGSLDNGATWTDITSKVSGTALSWNGVTLAGSDTLQLRIVDAAGNTGSAKTQAYVLDTSTPATPGTPDLATASDTGPLNNDNITLDTTPTLSGTAENGSTVTIYDGATLLGTVTAGAGGWTYTTGVLGEGSHTLTAVSTDTAGNASAASAGLTVTIDATAPAVTSVAVPANGTYYGGNALDFTVNFDEAVIVDTFGGTPRIAVVVGATTRYADYVSGSGTSALVFRYTVPTGDLDANGITVGALSSNGALMQDAAGNDAVTTLNSVGSTAAVDVDGTQPSITNVGASTADGAYGSGQTITITVDFSNAVTVDTTGGTPTLALDGGGSATYIGGSGTGTLSFSYVVGAGQNSADLDYSGTSALALNGATIVDAGGAHVAASVALATPGTAGSLGANKDIVVDTAAPTNTVASASFSADTGTSGSDFITRVAAQTVSGTLSANLAAGESVYVSLDNGATWALATASVGANTWSLAGQTLSGSGTLRVRVTDDAGNNGAAYAQAYVLDTTAPTIGFGNLALSADTGASHADFITNSAAQTLSATLSGAPAAGDIVYGSLDNGATWTDITSKVSGTTLTWTGITLAASDTLKLRVTDAAGNDGAATSQAYVLDTTAPTTSVASAAFSNDSGSSSSDFITNAAAQTVSGTLSANLVAGETVYVSLDNGATWSAATGAVGSNAWSLAGQTLTASNTLQVKVSDAAGNDGAVLSQAYVLDTTAPTIVFSNLALSADTGTSSSDFITRIAAQTLTATLSAPLAAGDAVFGSLDGGTTWVDITAKVGGTTLSWDGIALAGSNTLLLRVTDNVGNDGAARAQAYVLDTTAPAMSLGNLALSADTGSSSSDFITRTAAQTVTVTLGAPLAANDIVLGSLDGGATWIDITGKVSGTRLSWSGVTLAGSNTLRLRITDAAGNDGATLARLYTLDTTAPTTTATSATRGDGGSVSGGLSAPLVAGESVAASLDGGATWVPALIGADGTTWSIANAGMGALQVQVLDAAGNASAPLVVSAATAPAQPPLQALPVPPLPPGPPSLPVEALPSAVHDAPPSDAPAVLPVFSETTSPSGTWVSSLDVDLSALDSTVLSASFDFRGARPEQAAFLPLLTRPAADGAFQIVVLPELRGSGESLISNRPMADFSAHGGDRFSLQLPVDTFAHADENAAIELSAQSADGTPLPRWLKFDARTARFEGTPPLGFEGTLTFKVVARDAQGREAVQVFKITVTKDASLKAAHAEWRLDLAEPAGRASLSDQLRIARGGAAGRLAALSRGAAEARSRT